MTPPTLPSGPNSLSSREAACGEDVAPPRESVPAADKAPGSMVNQCRVDERSVGDDTGGAGYGILGEIIGSCARPRSDIAGSLGR